MKKLSLPLSDNSSKIARTSITHFQNRVKKLNTNKNLLNIISFSLLKPIGNLVRNLNEIIFKFRKYYYKNCLNNSKHIENFQSHKHKKINDELDTTVNFNEYTSSKTKDLKQDEEQHKKQCELCSQINQKM